MSLSIFCEASEYLKELYLTIITYLKVIYSNWELVDMVLDSAIGFKQYVTATWTGVQQCIA